MPAELIGWKNGRANNQSAPSPEQRHRFEVGGGGQWRPGVSNLTASRLAASIRAPLRWHQQVVMTRGLTGSRDADTLAAVGKDDTRVT